MPQVNPWRLVCKTGLRQILDSCRSGSTVYVAGERKGLIGDPILTYQGSPVADGYSLYSFALTGTPGGAATPIASVTSDVIRCLLQVGDAVYAAGSTDGKGDLWVLHDGTWAGGSLWREDEAEVGDIKQVAWWENRLWLRDGDALWSVDVIGDVRSEGGAPNSLLAFSGDLLSAGSNRRTQTADGSVTWYVQRREARDWSPNAPEVWSGHEGAATPPGVETRLLGDPHLLLSVDDRAARDVRDWASRGFYWQRELDDVSLTQASESAGLEIIRTALAGGSDKRTSSPLKPTVGMTIEPGSSCVTGERLLAAEGIPLAGSNSTSLHLWPWMNGSRRLPHAEIADLPRATDTFLAAFFDGFGEDGKPSYTVSSIATQSETCHVTSLRRSGGKVYAGVVDRLRQDILPLDVLYADTWPPYTSWRTATRAWLTQFAPTAEYGYCSPPSGGYSGTRPADNPFEPGTPEWFFWNGGTHEPKRVYDADPGGCAEHPTFAVETDDTQAWLYQVSASAFRRLLPHDSRQVALSAVDGWASEWSVSGRLQEGSDAGSAILCAASDGGNIYVGMDGLVAWAGSAHDSWVTEEIPGRAVEACSMHGLVPWLAAVGATDTQILYRDSGAWAIAQTLSGAYRCLCEHSSSLYAFGIGSAYRFDAGHPTGEGVTVTGLGGSEEVLSSYSDGTDLWIGTDAGRVLKLSGGTWSVVTVSGMPSGASVTSLRWWQGRLWIGLTTELGAVLDIASVSLPAGGGLWAVGDEGERTVLALTEGTGAVEAFALADDDPAIAMLGIYDDAGGVALWFSSLVTTRQTSPRMTLANPGSTDGRMIDDRLAAFYSTSYHGGTLSELFPWVDSGGDVTFVVSGSTYSADDYWDAVDAEDAATGRQEDMALPCPAFATHANATSPGSTGAYDLWATTEADSYDLSDYRPVEEGVFVELRRPSPYIRFAARLATGAEFRGLAVHLKTEAI